MSTESQVTSQKSTCDDSPFKRRTSSSSIIKHFKKKDTSGLLNNSVNHNAARTTNPGSNGPHLSSSDIRSIRSSSCSTTKSDTSLLTVGTLSNTTTPTHNSHNTSNIHTKENLRLFKKLEHGLVKFEAKPNGLLKTNILRITLLPFLRSQSKHIGNNTKSAATIITCLTKWWTAILTALKSSHPQPVSPSDRGAYLECISRIVARKEWNLFAISTTATSANANYQALLTQTLDYAISRLNIRNISLSTSAFVGKIFAYSFFALPDVSTALLFLLGVKQISLEDLSKQVFEKNNFTNTYSKMRDARESLVTRFPPHVRHIVGYNGKQQVPRSEKKFLNAMFAPANPVQGIVDPKGLWVKRWCSFDSDIFWSFLRHYLHIVSDILASAAVLSSTSASASSSSSVSSTPISSPLPASLTSPPHNILVACPGFMVILAHCLENISDSVWQRCKKSAKMPNASGSKDFNISLISPPPFAAPGQSSSPLQSQQQGKLNRQIDQVTNISTNVLKFLQTLREFLHNPYNQNEASMAPFVIHIFDQTLQCYASKISAYNTETSGYVLDIASEFMASVVKIAGMSSNQKKLFASSSSSSSSSASSSQAALSLDWNFWICAMQNMLETSNINCELKALSTLYNIWDLLPSSSCPHSFKTLPKWFINDQESTKWNVVTWVISLPVFDKYFCHWQPLVRSYYQRLICWRLVVFTNSALSEQDESIRRTIENRLNSIFEFLQSLVHDLKATDSKIPEMSASTPMANRKIVINRILQNNEFFIPDSLTNEVLTLPPSSSMNNINRKIHAYEIFDDAIYCSSSTLDSNKKPAALSSSAIPQSKNVSTGQSNRNQPQRSASSSTLVGSALKFFKKSAGVLKEDTEAPKSPSPPRTPQQQQQQVLQPLAESPSSEQTISSSILFFPPPSNLAKTFSSLSLSSRSSSPSLMSLSNNNSSPRSSSISDLSDLDSLDLKDDLNDDALNNEDDSFMENSPLPPELGKRAPEIVRSAYKFQLVFNDTGLQKQLQLIKDKSFIRKSCLNNSTIMDGHDVPKTVKFPKLEKIINKETPQYYYNSDQDDDDDDEDEDEECQNSSADTSAGSAEDIFQIGQRIRRSQEQQIVNRFRKMEFGNSNVSYIGRCINEWNLIVTELETFLETYSSNGGDLSQIDRLVPYLDLDYPNKAINAY